MDEAQDPRAARLADALERYADAVYRAAFVYLRSRPDAEDAVQDVFLQFYRHDKPFNDAAHLKAWLLRVTANRCKSLLRSPWHRRICVAEPPAAAAVEDKDRRALVQAVLALPPKYRDAVYLYYYEGYATAEIAQILREKEATVRTRLARGRALLKTRLEGVDFDAV